MLAAGTGRDSSRGGGEVIELKCEITVYPARSEGGRRRAGWHEAGQREQCEADAPNMRQPGTGLIAHYLVRDRLVAARR